MDAAGRTADGDTFAGVARETIQLLTVKNKNLASCRLIQIIDLKASV